MSVRYFWLFSSYKISVWKRPVRNFRDYSYTIKCWKGSSQGPISVHGDSLKEAMGKIRLEIALAENPGARKIHDRLTRKHL